jgi:hypothetical protein
MFKKVKGIFFGEKENTIDEKRLEKLIQLIINNIPKFRQLIRDNGVPQISTAQSDITDGEIISRMYDFYQNWNATDNQINFGDMSVNPIVVQPAIENNKDERIIATPVSVMVELETVPTPFTIENLDEKIETLNDKNKLINQRYAKEQIKALIKRLENRKKYETEFDFYNSFPNTTDEKIDVLLAKYKLEINTAELFVPTFPKEAIQIMKKYTEVTQRISGENPVFYVIAQPKDFKKKREKLDPILLVQSPFGFYWQILGAWDVEMLMLSEL